MARQYTRQVQVGIKIEASEGVAESLTAAEFSLNLMGQPGYDLDSQRTDREIVQAALSKRTMVPGHRGLVITGQAELAGGVLATPPKWHDLLRAMGFARTAAKFITITSVTAGPFRTGQIIGNHATLGSATATGRVLMMHNDGTTIRLFYRPITGTFGSSGTVANYESTQTSATISAGPADGGWYFAPQSEYSGSVPASATMQFRDGTQVFATQGARGSGSIRLAVGETGHLEFNMQGPAVLDLERDPPGPELDGFVASVAYPAAPPGILAVPLVMRHAGVDEYFTPVLPEITIQINNTIAPRPTITDVDIASSGRMPALITDREITLAIEPEADPANFDLIANDYAATTFEVGFAASSPVVSGGAIGAYIPAAQTTGNMAPGDRDGLRTAAPSIRATGSADDEILIFHLLTA